MRETKTSPMWLLYKNYLEELETMVSCPIWHYTNVDGFQGIVRDNSEDHGRLHFWFTRSDCLNDSSEGNHIVELFNQTCNKLLNKNRIDIDFYQLIQSVNISGDSSINLLLPPKPTQDDDLAVQIPSEAYICSFSVQEDSLDMWRYYSKGNGGFGLRFVPYLFEDCGSIRYHMEDDQSIDLNPMRSYKVIYNTERKEAILRGIILDIYDTYKTESNNELNAKDLVISLIQYALKTLRFQFKNECFSSEQEFRFVYFRPKKNVIGIQGSPQIKFRKQGGILIPYIDIAVEEAFFKLREVRISPLIEAENACITTKDYVDQCGFIAEVQQSLLPVRK